MSYPRSVHPPRGAVWVVAIGVGAAQWFLGAAGCSSEPAGPPADEALALLATSACEAYVECDCIDGSELPSFTTQRECEQAQEERLRDAFAEDVAAGRRYQPACVQHALDRIDPSKRNVCPATPR